MGLHPSLVHLNLKNKQLNSTYWYNCSVCDSATLITRGCKQLVWFILCVEFLIGEAAGISVVLKWLQDIFKKLNTEFSHFIISYHNLKSHLDDFRPTHSATDKEGNVIIFSDCWDGANINLLSFVPHCRTKNTQEPIWHWFVPTSIVHWSQQDVYLLSHAANVY